jgi:transposase
MPKAFPPSSSAVTWSRWRKGKAPLSQIAKDFGISESCLHRRLKLADIDDGPRPGMTSSESAELRTGRPPIDRSRTRTLRRPWSSACTPQP